ncbi:hypothetical protein C1H46_011491 [Malus baccata]|uniref:Uncharacterized protein n=1 Tax=Malus baccata TaxID=106549 RepID=A0A540MVV5_MALBA|nr:hypothetical protein C1H46_011491 [Malus baccata]
MSHLIRTQRAMTSTPSLTATPSPMTTLTIAATTSAEMDHRPVNPVDPVCPPVPQAQALSTSSVVLPVSARFTHRHPRTTNQMSPFGSTTDASGTLPDLLPYAVEVLEGDAGGDEEHGAQPIVLLMIHRLLSRRVIRRSWRIDNIVRFGFAVIFKSQKKMKANNINQEKKTLLHHLGSRPFSYRMEA